MATPLPELVLAVVLRPAPAPAPAPTPTPTPGAVLAAGPAPAGTLTTPPASERCIGLHRMTTVGRDETRARHEAALLARLRDPQA